MKHLLVGFFIAYVMHKFAVLSIGHLFAEIKTPLFQQLVYLVLLVLNTLVGGFTSFNIHTYLEEKDRQAKKKKMAAFR